MSHSHRSFALELPAVSEFRYRPDVDGLRAVAVVLVLLFHAGFGFSGGFVGVDVFFVISGYLITGLILKEQAADKFSLSTFWVRRIRRIIPAASAMAAVTFVMGGFLLLPADFEDLGQSTIAQQLMGSNIYFWRTTGYFSGPAELKPLLHTWSLAVEEQFYIGYPFLLLFLRKFRPRTVGALLASLTLVSCAASQWFVHSFPAATFYLLPTRAWEMLIGGLLWFLPAPSRLKPWLAQLLTLTGLSAIVICGVAYNSQTPFPGAMALPPCLGAAMLIYGGSSGTTWVARGLAWKPIVAVGLVSYSLYLWHWPILAYLRYWQGGVGAGWRVAALVATGFAAYLSYRWVETPFRHRASLSTFRSAIRFASFSAAAMAGLGFAAWELDGLPNRFSTEFQTALEQANWNGYDLLQSQPIDPDTRLVRLGAVSDGGPPPRVLIWGDSHAMMCTEAINVAAREAGLEVLAEVVPGLPPVPGLHAVWNHRHEPIETLVQDDHIVKIAMRPQFTDVVLICRWSLYVEGNTEFEYEEETRGASPMYHAAPVEELAADFERGLVSMTRQLCAAGKRVWIFRQIPEINQRLADRVIQSQRFDTPLQVVPVSRDSFQVRQQRITPVLNELERFGARVIDPGRQLFDEQGNVIGLRAGQSLYRDDDHLSRIGVDLIIRPALEEIFRTVQFGPLVATTESSGAVDQN
ncbi:MAG: acyltransferase family protein [Planctomycetaceae bacterium]